MLLALHSLLWRHGAPAAITGTCDTEQARQNTNAVGEIPALGGGYWAHFGQRHWSAPRYKPAPSVPLPIAAFSPVVIFGYAETEQRLQVTIGDAEMIDVELELFAAMLLVS